MFKNYCIRSGGPAAPREWCQCHTLSQIPLHKAASRGHGAVIQLLLENGAETSVMDTACSETPLHMVAF